MPFISRLNFSFESNQPPTYYGILLQYKWQNHIVDHDECSLARRAHPTPQEGFVYSFVSSSNKTFSLLLADVFPVECNNLRRQVDPRWNFLPCHSFMCLNYLDSVRLSPASPARLRPPWLAFPPWRLAAISPRSWWIALLAPAII